MNLPVLRLLLLLLVVGDALLIPGFQTSHRFSLFLVAINLLFHASALVIALKFPEKFVSCKIPFIASSLISLGLFLHGQGAAGLGYISLASFALCWLLLHPQLLKSFRPGLLLALLLPLFLPLALAQVLEPQLNHFAHAAETQNPNGTKTQEFPDIKTHNKQGPGKGAKKAPASDADSSVLSLDSPSPDPVPELIASLKFLPGGQHPPHPPYYLRETAFVAFNGQNWYSPSLPSRLVQDVNDGWLSLGPGSARSLHYQITLAERESRRLLALPGVSQLRLPQVRFDSSQTCFLPDKSAPGLVYQAQSVQVFYSQCPPATIVPGRTDPAYLQMPQDGLVYEEIRRSAAKLTVGLRSPAEKIAAIQSFLHSNFTYELSADQHSLEEFFLRRKKGHCTFFASICTLMLRSLKIPARVAIGYSSNHYDESIDSYQFLSDQRHAWCEIFLDKYGWVTLDPTPASAIVNIANSSNLPGGGAAKDPNEADAPAAASSALSSPSSALAILLILAAIAFFLRVPALTRRHRDSAAECQDRPRYAPLTEFYRIFCQTFSQLGAPRQDGETGRDYLHRLKQLGLVDHQFDELMRYYYQLRYEECPAELRREKEFLAELKRFRRERKLG